MQAESQLCGNHWLLGRKSQIVQPKKDLGGIREARGLLVSVGVRDSPIAWQIQLFRLSRGLASNWSQKASATPGVGVLGIMPGGEILIYRAQPLWRVRYGRQHLGVDEQGVQVLSLQSE